MIIDICTYTATTEPTYRVPPFFRIAWSQVTFNVNALSNRPRVQPENNMKYMEQLQTRSSTVASSTSVHFKDFECPTAEVGLKKWELG
jgi:hypothetical protein